MHNDFKRNEFFKLSVCSRPRCDLECWLEVGPGALGTLTSIVLDNLPRSSVVAIEAVENSVEVLHRQLRQHVGSGRLQVSSAGQLKTSEYYGFNHSCSTLGQIVHGCAGRVHLPDPGIRFDGVIAEVLGHIASLEGYPRILWELGRSYKSSMETVQYYTPAYFGSVVVPISLPRCEHGNNIRIACLGPKEVLVRGLPFDDIQVSCSASVPDPNAHLPAGHLVFEMYRAREVVAYGMQNRVPDIQCADLNWTVGEDHSIFSGFGIYLVYSNESRGPFMTTNYSGVNKSVPGGWDNLLLPVKVEVDCMKGDKIHFTSKCHTFGAHDPFYQFQFSIVRDRNILLDSKFELRYSDIICPFLSLKDWKAQEELKKTT